MGAAKKVLLEVDDDTLKTMDGAIYLLEPEGIPVSCTWLPTTQLMVENENRKIKITNLNTGTSVYGRRL